MNTKDNQMCSTETIWKLNYDLFTVLCANTCQFYKFTFKIFKILKFLKILNVNL
jgi:hypothetical protein